MMMNIPEMGWTNPNTIQKQNKDNNIIDNITNELERHIK